jgi:hypothetical protein
MIDEWEVSMKSIILAMYILGVSSSPKAFGEAFPVGQFVATDGTPIQFKQNGIVILNKEGMDDYATGRLVYNGKTGGMNEDLYTLTIGGASCQMVFTTRQDQSVNVRKIKGPNSCLKGVLEPASENQIDSFLEEKNVPLVPSASR